MKFSIVSEYASFIVLENDAEYRRWKVDRRNAVRVKRDREAQQRVRDELERLRAEAAAQLGPQKSETQFVDANDQPQDSPSVSQPARPSVPRNQSRTSRDISVPGFSQGGGGGAGGGAIDPITGLIALGLGGAVAASRRRKRKR